MKLLPKETINDQYSLDSLFVEMHAAYEKDKVPMSDDQTIGSISIMMVSDAQIDEIYESFSKYWNAVAFFKRCEIFPIKYEKRLLVWFCFMGLDFGLGGMILTAYYLQWAAYRFLKTEWAANGGRGEMQNEIDLSFVCERVFPWGVFTKELVHEFWDKQKLSCPFPDNLIDYPTAALSFMPSKETEPFIPKF